jgi:hypothetical protein
MQKTIKKICLPVKIAALATVVLLPCALPAEPASGTASPGIVQMPPDQPENGAEQLVLSLSRPTEPGVLILQHHKGRVRVTGYDGEVVVVNAALRYPDTTGAGTDVRPLPGQALKLHALEKNNVVTISTNSHERTIDLEIRVPHSFSLHIEKYDSGTVSAYYLRGEIEITSAAGGVHLTDITGSAVISTVDGDIFLRFAEVTPHVPMAFTSVGGNIDVAFPRNLSAVVKMRTDHGEIMSDFDIETARRRSETEVSQSTGIRRAFLEQWTHGTIGGGGPQLLFRSYHGNIIIRKVRNVSPE